MKRLFLIFALSSPLMAQTGAITDFCKQGATPANTSGLQSSNNLQGVVPGCLVSVYVTGTTNLATIFADGSSTPLSNPFTANTTTGQWIFYAAVNQGYDVVLSGGIPPNTYQSPLTLTDLFPASAFSTTSTPAPPAFAVQLANSLANAFQADPNITINPTTHVFTAPAYVLTGCPSGQVIRGDGLGCIAPGTASNPGGTNTQLQFNNSSAFGGATATWDGSYINTPSDLPTGHQLASANAAVTTVTLAQYGGVNDGVTDIGTALQAAYNSVVTSGGEVYMNCIPLACYWANPTTFNWGSTGGHQIAIRGKGSLNLGSTVTFPGGVTPVGDNGAVPVQFGTGPLFAINGPATTGTLGTTFTVATNPATNPPTTAETITPSIMTNIYPNTVLTVIPHYTGATACVITSVVRASNKVTATMSGVCHIPAGVNVTIAGVTDSSFNGTFFETGSEYVPASANVLSWSQTAANATSSGGTASGINEDHIENALCTATTLTTATCNFKYSHDSTDNWYINGTTITGLAHSIRDVQFTSGGTALRFYKAGWVDAHNISVKTGASDGQQGTEIYLGLIMNFYDSTFGAFGGFQSWAIHYTGGYDIAFGSGDVSFEGGTIMAGIKEDVGAQALVLKNVVIEQATRGGVIMDNSDSQAVTGYNRLLLDNTGTQDLANGVLNQCFLNSFYGGTEPEEGIVTGFFAPASTSCIIGDHYQGRVDVKTSNGGQFGLNTAQGTRGTFSSKGIQDSELLGESADMGPSVIPYASLNVPTNPASWSGTCSVATGQLAPDGTATAGGLTHGSAGANILLSYSVTPSVGDYVLFGGWVQSDVGTALAGGQAAAFTIDNGGLSTHAQFSAPGQTLANLITSNFYDQQMSGQAWHPVVALAQFATADGTAGVVRIDINCKAGATMYYWHPFMMYVPASAGITLKEINRWRTQLLHGAVPSNAVAGTAYTDSPIQAASYAGKGTATFAAGAAAGTSPGTPTCTTSHICDSMSGTVSFTAGTATTTGIMLTVTTGITRTNQVNCTGQVYLAASPYTALPTRITATTTTIVFNVGTGPTASTAYELVYSGCGGN